MESKRKATLEYLDEAEGSPRRTRAQSVQVQQPSAKGSVGVQTIIPPRNYVYPAVASSHRLSLLDFPKFLYMPHTVTFLVLGLLSFIYVSWKHNDPDQPFIYTLRRYHFLDFCWPFTKQRAYWECSNVCVVCSSIFPRFTAKSAASSILAHDPRRFLFLSPLCCVYAIPGIIYFVFDVADFHNIEQDLDTGRQVLKYLDPRLGVPLPDKDYAIDCRLYTPENPESSFANFKNVVFDIYIIAHWFGWWFKMLIFRDVQICIYLSVTFEGLELTFKHWLPNFAECWWDSLILDIMLCNMMGIFLGYLTCKYLEMGSFKWFLTENEKRQKKSTFTGEAAKILGLFRPYTWTKYNWHMFSSLQNFLNVSWVVFINDIVDLNNFFLKHVFWIPANHWTLVLRVLLLGFLAMSFVKEYYYFMNNKEYRRFSSTLWLAHFIAIAELALWLKHAPGSSSFRIFFLSKKKRPIK